MVILILTSIATFLVPANLTNEVNETTPFYVGVTFCGNTTAEAKLLIERVKAYTNLFVLQSGPISKNETATNEICDYAVAAGLYIIVYFGVFDCPWHLPWLDMAMQRWGYRFLGVYFYDEPAGYMLDEGYRFNSSNYKLPKPANYDEAAQWFVDFFERSHGLTALKTRLITSFTSDYTLYWFDWLAGYDVMLAQVGWNHSLIQDIALIRGAARMQNKSWGAIITWKYDEPPYLDSGEAIYRQMLMAYECGAKYIMIFNYPKINDYGIMADEHFEALERFWNDIVAMPQAVHGSIKAEAALVLPRNYGWGMRQPNDKIWGWWGPDEKTPQIWALSRQLLSQYELLLDIVYEDSAFPVKGEYQKIYYWNHTISSD